MRYAALGLAFLATAAAAQASDNLSLEVQKIRSDAGLRVVVFTVENRGTARVGTVVVTCDGFDATGAAVASATAGVYELAAGRKGIGEAAFTNKDVAKADCRITTVL